jgi:hypothetical protein
LEGERERVGRRKGESWKEKGREGYNEGRIKERERERMKI